MRFTEFLKEDVTSLAVSLQPFKKNIATMLKQQKYFYRVQSHGSFKTDKISGLNWSVIAERDTRRVSLSGNNMLMYISTKWKNVPDRSLSYYASQARDSFAGVGAGDAQYLIVPADSIKKFGFSQEDFNFDERTTSRSETMMIISDIASVYVATMAVESDDSLTNIILNNLCKAYGFDRKINMRLSKMPLTTISRLFEFIDALYLQYDKLAVDKSKAPNTIYFMHKLTKLRERIESAGYSTVSEALESIDSKVWGVSGYSSIAAIPHSDTADNEMWWKGSYLAINLASGESPDAILSKIYKMLTV